MKNSFIILILFMALADIAARAGDIRGKLIDADTNEPVVGAVIKAVGDNGFTSSRADGTFILKGPAARISIRCMGYESIEVDVPLKSPEIMMLAKETVLNEVVVQAPDIFQKGDTLVFDVGRYATGADDAIIDVIRRLPGVKVEKDGTIMYQGKPVNKFYIDGNDFIGDSYNLATNNISKNDVASVEVLENHQPVKALEDIEFSDQAGINLKLKEDARSRWVGVANAGSGFSPLLYSGSVFAMRLARKLQNIFTLKADNTGWNPVNEITDRSYEPMFSSTYKETLWNDYITADHTTSPLAESRTRDSSSWLASAITSWGSGDVANRLKINYMSDRLDYHTSETTDYMSAEIPSFIQNEVMRTHCHSFAVDLKTEINRKGYFLKDNITVNGEWQHTHSSVTGSEELKQAVSRCRLAATNDIRFIKKTDKNIFTLSSRNSFTHNPSELRVNATDMEPVQKLGINDFRSTTESQYGWIKDFWRIYADGGIDINYHHLNSNLSDFPIYYPHSGTYDAFLSSVYVSPKAEYDRKGWKITLRSPLQWQHYSIRGNHDFLTFCPEAWVRRQLTAKSDVAFFASYSSFAPGAFMFVDCAVLSDYRNLFKGISVRESTRSVSLSGTYRYRNPLSAVFANASAAYSYIKTPVRSNQVFYDDLVVTTYASLPTGCNTFTTKGGVSKGLCHSRLVIGLDATYSYSASSAMRDNLNRDFRQNAVVVSPYLKGSLTKWLYMNYAANINFNSMKIDSAAADNASSIDQVLSFTVIPSERLNFTVGAEHYFTHFGDENTKDASMILLDASAAWQITDRIRLNFTARNVLDSKYYRYTTFGTLSQTDYSYRIRPRNILASLQFRF